MKKIGIITFHRAINYGAMLQAIALQQAVSKLGYDAELIDYVDRLYDHYKISYKTSNPVTSGVKYLFSGNARKRNQRFEQFLLDNAKLSARQYNSGNISSFDETSYTAFITGSDQTFNPIIVDYDDNYVLGFVKDKNKCNSYAASIGLAELTEENRKWIKSNVEGYHSVLVREKTGIELLNGLGIFNTLLVCDPTFLISSDTWKKMQHPVKTPKHYILHYGFKRNNLMEAKARQLSIETGYPIYTISDRIKRDERGYEKFSGIGPGEWLYLIAHADHIVTNSFHGMIFSFIFNRQVWIADSNDGTFSRMEDFLDEMNCTYRILKGADSEVEERMIPYDKVNQLMREYINESKDILKETLRDYKDE